MKTITIENQYANVLIDFINNELLKNTKQLENVITFGNQTINNKDVFLYDCFQSLSKKYTLEQIEKSFDMWFPYGILISPYEFSYEVVKKYTLYLANTYNLIEKDLLFNPESFFQLSSPPELVEKLKNIFNNYKNHNNCLNQLKSALEQNESITITIDEKKFLKTKMIINVTEKNKHFLEFLLEEGIYCGNSVIEYAGKEILLLEYLLLRSLTASKEIIKKLMLTVNKKNLLQMKTNIEKIDLSYLNNFKEELENFNENIRLLEKKMLLLKYEEDDRSSSGSSSKGVVKI